MSWEENLVIALVHKMNFARDMDERLNAMSKLGKMGEKASAAVPDLLKALENENWALRVNAAEALGRICADADRVVPALVKALKDEYSNVRIYAGIALASFGERAIPEIRSAVAGGVLSHSEAERAVRNIAAHMRAGRVGNGVVRLPLERARPEGVRRIA